MMSKKAADRPVAEMGLPASVSNVFAARNIKTAKDALSLTEFDLMELSGLGLDQVRSAVLQISEELSPPCQTGLSLWVKRLQKEQWGGHLPTRLKGLDDALCGGIPFGVITEVVGPAGIGKTQFCLKLALLAALPLSHGDFDGQVIYVDVEFKFNTKRLIEIGTKSFPYIFNGKETAQEITRRILVLRPSSLSEFTESLERINILMLQRRVKLLVIDSMTALVSGENEHGTARKSPLSWHISFLKSAAEASRVPILVTNQVRSQSPNEVFQYNFEVGTRQEYLWGPPDFDSCLVAALGVQWSHAVTIRLILEAISGQRFMKVAKSPMSPPLAFPFCIISSGISLLDDCGRELVGKQIHAISCQDLNPKISYFVLTRLDEVEKTHVSTKVAVAKGYMAPEYAMWGYLSYKADVYSFGVAVLEIVSVQNNDSFVPSEVHFCILDWAYHLYQSGNLMELMDKNLRPEFNKEEVEMVLKVALLCTHASPEPRSTMPEVVGMREGRMAVLEMIPGPGPLTQDPWFWATRDLQELRHHSQTGSESRHLSMVHTFCSSAGSKGMNHRNQSREKAIFIVSQFVCNPPPLVEVVKCRSI